MTTRSGLRQAPIEPISPATPTFGLSFMAAVSTTPVLTDDDPLRDWIDRGFDLYGLGRHPGLHPLFGLKLRDDDPEPFSRSAPGGGLATRNRGPASTQAETDRFRQKIRAAEGA